jgi:LPS O-antigen subunit length determinant protein (WzzB/FepE family)
LCKIEQLLNIPLTTQQKQYVADSLKQYLEKQNQEVILNPKSYIESIKSKAFLRIQELKDDLTKYD